MKNERLVNEDLEKVVGQFINVCSTNEASERLDMVGHYLCPYSVAPEAHCAYMDLFKSVNFDRKNYRPCTFEREE